jgi:hypothetical protein
MLRPIAERRRGLPNDGAPRERDQAAMPVAPVLSLTGMPG